MIDQQVLSDFMDGFYGYGHLGAKYWFIGLEEGAIAELAEFERRLKAWDSLDRRQLADIRLFHRQLGGRLVQAPRLEMQEGAIGEQTRHKVHTPLPLSTSGGLSYLLPSNIRPKEGC